MTVQNEARAALERAAAAYSKRSGIPVEQLLAAGDPDPDEPEHRPLRPPSRRPVRDPSEGGPNRP